ncbi:MULTISPECIES: DnaJ C-terminal domain-containing protein [Bradyrhizobium]|uniref:J domain-containing protein n=1 Tax=Bradyrhizobium arachidis TaxID=858423 RepID=A0AAE7NLQ7_9BRAD|nr:MULTISPECIES: J domain-containing protein [Bradyrhizobium]QOG21501.1 DnaJ domain-containing protein [Bradyrhizobium sp. SEMIA]QOZ67247.1 J domain-containing protein [Bradyrhizobium arachidis]UFW51940.1 J domain-containing protein [Bradyrhizobium arachidis]SFV16814.1 DnaJ-class molecular chaperone with C-terminal Zn finger domain [Bradyrhizobium arachidis]
MRDPYEVLGVPRSANAAAIKSAYRKLAKKHHPDSNKGDPKAAERFAEINSANEILGDEDKRKQFDRGEIDADGKPRFQGFPGGGGPRGRAGPGGFESYTFRSGGAGGGPGGGAFEDILNSMFGGGTRGARPGAGGGAQFEFDTGGIGLDLDVNVAMSVSLEEAVKGGEKRVRLPNGKELNVKIPAGVTEGQQIRLRGQGETAQGHPPGDLLLTINIAPHPYFKVEGADLRIDLPVTLYEAVLGGKVRVPTLGNAVELSVPKNTSSGRTFRLKGKGLPKAGGTGDLFVTIRIMLPDGNDAELEALMEKWRDQHPYNPRSGLG